MSGKNTLCTWIGLLFCFSLMLTAQRGYAWGFWAHQRINRLAVFTLPPEMLVLYKKHMSYLTEHAVDPDKRRYAVDGEAAHHYIDIDHFGAYPYENVPRYWDDAVRKFTADTLEAFGVLPYHVPTVVYQLKKAFENKDLTRIMKISADLGHYIGDAHVPLHTTENYNGQLTGQKGIHGFWESRLPELFGSQYDFFVGKCYYVEDLYMETWDIVMESHIRLDSVLGGEAELNADFPKDKKYGYESRNNVVVRTYSRDYSTAYHELLNGMVERRMQASIRRVGSYWYTAWRLAGSPDLGELANQKIEAKPQKYKKRFKILDREAQSIGLLLGDGCCCRPKAQPFGLARTLSCVQEAPAWALAQEEETVEKGQTERDPWYAPLQRFANRWLW